VVFETILMSFRKSLIERLQEGVVFCGEGYLFGLEKRGYVQVGPYVPTVVLDYPGAVKELHREFMRCGSDVVPAFTYYAHREKMRLVGREHQLEELNRKAIRLAKEVAAEGNCLVAGDICNTNVWEPTLPETQEEARTMFREQCQWAKEEGVDFIIAETLSYYGEANAALEEIKKVGLPAVVTLSFHKSGEMRDGVNVIEAMKRLAENGATVVGLNCARGPATMYEYLKEAKKVLPPHVGLAALPVPYKTTAEKPTFQSLCRHEAMYLELEPYTHTRFEMADWAVKFSQIGVNYLGVCCGGEPYMLRAMAEAVGRGTMASDYSPDLSKHFAYGNHASLKPWNQKDKVNF